MLKNLAIALLMTLALEFAFAALWGVKGKENYKLVGMVNLLTNPPVNLLYAVAVPLWHLPMLPVIAALEIGAVVVEWLCYRSLSKIYRPFLFSLCVNAFSFCAGCLLQVFF